MQEIKLQGTPFEIGFKHGQQFTERVKSQAKELWTDSINDNLAKVIETSAEYIEAGFPDINEEISGIAKGAGITFEQAFLFNNRSIIGAANEGCTNLAISKDGNILMGMNKDMPNPDPSIYFVKKAIRDKGYSSIGYGHIGRVWGYGVNSAGLCMAGTSAEPLDNIHKTPSIGLYLISPIIMPRCGSVKEALDLMLSIETLSESGNVMLADSSGEVVVVEVSPQKRVVRKMEDGLICSTNFYASGTIPHSSSEDYIAETTARYATVGRMLSGKETVSAEDVKLVLSSHDPNGPVCRHNSLGLSTVLSWIAEPETRKLYIHSGTACEGEYMEYTLED